MKRVFCLCFVLALATACHLPTGLDEWRVERSERIDLQSCYAKQPWGVDVVPCE